MHTAYRKEEALFDGDGTTSADPVSYLMCGSAGSGFIDTIREKV